VTNTVDFAPTRQRRFELWVQISALLCADVMLFIAVVHSPPNDFCYFQRVGTINCITGTKRVVMDPGRSAHPHDGLTIFKPARI
jgi:hypothetical protein